MNEIKGMDIITLYSLYVQLENIKEDREQNFFINLVIKTIAYEIEKLHKENEEIIKQNNKILDILLKG